LVRAPAEEKIAFSAEELRPPSSSRWVVSLVKRLFGASITAADGQAPVWHEDVRYFQIADETGDRFLFGSLQSPSPEAGWGVDVHRSCQILMKWHDHHPKAVAYLVCNQTPL